MYFDDSSVEYGYMWHNLHTYFVEMGNLCPQKTLFHIKYSILPVWHCVVQLMYMILLSSCRFYTNEHDNMFYICLSIVSILYVCTGCCVLFVSCNKNNVWSVYFAIFTLYHLVFVSFFSAWLMALENALAICKANVKLWCFLQVQTHIEKSFPETFDAALLVLSYLAISSFYSLFISVL